MALTTTELAEFARRARELMNDSGRHWVQGSYQLGSSFCSIGALRKSLFGEAQGGFYINEGDSRFIAITHALAEAIEEKYPAFVTKQEDEHGEVKDVDLVINFNDDEETKWEDVERIFMRAEEILS
jgi:hypothetical protein